VQVHRVQDRTPDVVLALVVGAVADAHRARVVVTGEVVEGLLVQVALPTHPVHDLQRVRRAVLAARDVADEAEEVVGLAVQAQRVQPPQRKRGVAHPGVAVVPVALPARGLRQGGRGGGEQGAGGGVGQPFERECALLQVGTPRVVREAAQGDPLPPALLGLPHGVRGLGPGLRGGQVRPAQGHEDVVALGQPRACPGLPPLQPQPQVGGELEGRMVPLLRRGHRDGLAVDVAGVLPAGPAAVVVEGRLAAQGQLDRAGDAAHRAAGRAGHPSRWGCACGCGSARRCCATGP